MRSRFISGYDCTGEYEIDGKIYSVRHGMHMTNSTGDYRQTLRSQIGTVMFKHSPDFGAFPSAEVVALFPGMVGARYGEETIAGKVPGPWTVEYDGATPEVVPAFHGTLFWGPWARACADETYEVAAKHLTQPSI